MKIFNENEITDDEIVDIFSDIVVIPTETVYGLAGRIDNDEVLSKIFKIKTRPTNNPLIVHISSIEMLKEFILEDDKTQISEEYQKLIDKYWPGPLTLIFKTNKKISKIIRGKCEDTIAVRMPKNKNLLRIISKLNIPLAAPSANKSGHPSPTRVSHVVSDLGDLVGNYIDGGECQFGLESTIFGNINGKSLLLRPGYITKEEIEGTLGYKIEYSKEEKGLIVPGMMYKHYSPNIPVYVFYGENFKTNMKTEYLKSKGEKKVGLMTQKNEIYEFTPYKTYKLGITLDEIGHNLFNGFLELEKTCDLIFIKAFNKSGKGLAIMDRVEKAMSKKIE